MRGVRSALRMLLGILAEAPAFATMAVVELDALGPAGRQVRERLLTRFRRLFAQCPPPPPGIGADLLADSVVGGVHSTVYRWIATGRHAELPELLPTLTIFALAPFLGPALAAERLAAAEAAQAPWSKPVLACVVDRAAPGVHAPLDPPATAR